MPSQVAVVFVLHSVFKAVDRVHRCGLNMCEVAWTVVCISWLSHLIFFMYGEKTVNNALNAQMSTVLFFMLVKLNIALFFFLT